MSPSQPKSFCDSLVFSFVIHYTGLDFAKRVWVCVYQFFLLGLGFFEVLQTCEKHSEKIFILSQIKSHVDTLSC